MLTTVLHLAGIIHGNPAYSDRLQYNNTPTFIGNGYTTELTHDLSHLADPIQLMNPYLAPGIRKLPSPLERQMLADLEAIAFFGRLKTLRLIQFIGFGR